MLQFSSLATTVPWGILSEAVCCRGSARGAAVEVRLSCGRQFCVGARRPVPAPQRCLNYVSAPAMF